MALNKKIFVPAMLSVTALAGVAGGSLLNSVSAHAATVPTTATTAATTSAAADPVDQPDPTQGGHVGANGTKEVVLTGDAATKATAAAQAAVPGGTIERVENDAEGATYEAHVTKSDGTDVTVKMDANFKVTGTESGRGTPSSSTTTH